MRFFKSLFHAKESRPHCTVGRKTEERCPMCSAVVTAGRSGEKTLRFVNNDTVRVEIINESNVPGRMCYTLNVLNDPEVGWADLPIRYCPWCARRLKE